MSLSGFLSCKPSRRCTRYRRLSDILTVSGISSAWARDRSNGDDEPPYDVMTYDPAGWSAYLLPPYSARSAPPRYEDVSSAEGSLSRRFSYNWINDAVYSGSIQSEPESLHTRMSRRITEIQSHFQPIIEENLSLASSNSLTSRMGASYSLILQNSVQAAVNSLESVTDLLADETQARRTFTPVKPVTPDGGILRHERLRTRAWVDIEGDARFQWYLEANVAITANSIKGWVILRRRWYSVLGLEVSQSSPQLASYRLQSVMILCAKQRNPGCHRVGSQPNGCLASPCIQVEVSKHIKADNIPAYGLKEYSMDAGTVLPLDLRGRWRMTYVKASSSRRSHMLEFYPSRMLEQAFDTRLTRMLACIQV